MESMGDVLRSMNNSELRQRSRALEDSLFNNPLIKKLQADHPELEESRWKLNISRLYQYVEDNNHCSNCPGLEKCPNDFPGHFSKLTVEAVNGSPDLYERKTPCSLKIAKDKENSIRKRIRSFYVDERVLNEGYNLVDIIGKDKERAKDVKLIFQYINETKARGLVPQGLYLYGGFGVGKTFLMCYLLHELAVAGYSGVIVYMPDFIEDLKSIMLEGQKLKETVETLKNCDVLIFDDIGAENLNPWARDHVLGAILNYRMNRKPTFYTSNYPLEGLEKHLSFTSKDGEEVYKGQRLMDRIAPFVEVIPLHGENQRGRARG
ncbi:primosomal protein DnaI [Paenibacillus silagei]|uniref:Primosomal protein DnaI n=1 Tax=Paenibacillus silagei TaxID=1670801 RepID=A0ABS4NUL2_9BACL|nr:primosomal protein DnaI [Paenibacillus silagei]MBP2113750.1 primosomal protein DnaI [Paenibacillus silagei]